MKKINYPCVVSIAGTDPSGGAGIQADIKTLSATGSYAASIVTALVAQNTQGVQSILSVSADFVKQQIESVFTDLDIAAVKIGMLHNKDIIDVVASSLKKIKPPYIVIDPVMVAKNGCALLSPDMISYLKEKIFLCASLITPNICETEKLLEVRIKTTEEMASAAKNLGKEFGINVLVKGGHLKGNLSSDVLYVSQQDTLYWFHADRISTKNTHGTGCTLSSAIASYLAQGYPIVESVSRSKKYLTHAILSGSQLNIGRGRGPVNHFYFLEKYPYDILSNA